MLFDKGMIPDDISTFEQLGVWWSDLMVAHGGFKEYNERQPNVGASDTGIQTIFETFGVLKSAQKDTRAIYRHAFLLADDYTSSAYPNQYNAAQVVLDVPVSVDYINPNYAGALQ